MRGIDGSSSLRSYSSSDGGRLPGPPVYPFSSREKRALSRRSQALGSKRYRSKCRDAEFALNRAGQHLNTLTSAVDARPECFESLGGRFERLEHEFYCVGRAVTCPHPRCQKQEGFPKCRYVLAAHLLSSSNTAAKEGGEVFLREQVGLLVIGGLRAVVADWKLAMFRWAKLRQFRDNAKHNARWVSTSVIRRQKHYSISAQTGDDEHMRR